MSRLEIRLHEFRYEIGRKAGNLGRVTVWKLPRKLAYWCAIRVIAHATTGPYADQNVPDLTAMDALQRWEVRHG